MWLDYKGEVGSSPLWRVAPWEEKEDNQDPEELFWNPDRREYIAPCSQSAPGFPIPSQSAVEIRTE